MGPGVSLPDLPSHFVKDPASHTAFMERRMAKVSGDKSTFASEPLLDPRKTRTSESSTNYDRTYESGTWQELCCFAEDLGLQQYDKTRDGDEELLVAAIQERFPRFLIRVDKKDGPLGVEIVDAIRGSVTP